VVRHTSFRAKEEHKWLHGTARRFISCDIAGFTNKELVALSGGHTIGFHHKSDGTTEGLDSTPFQFDTDYFRLLLNQARVGSCAAGIALRGGAAYDSREGTVRRYDR
jgi:hypothetical protein